MRSMQTSKNYTAGFYFKRELDRDTKAILVQNQICSSIFDDFVSL